MIQNLKDHVRAELKSLDSEPLIVRVTLILAYFFIFIYCAVIVKDVPYWSSNIQRLGLYSITQIIALFGLNLLAIFICCNRTLAKNIHSFPVIFILILMIPPLFGWVIEKEAAFSSTQLIIAFCAFSIIMQFAYAAHHKLFPLFFALTLFLISIFKYQDQSAEFIWFLLGGIFSAPLFIISANLQNDVSLSKSKLWMVSFFLSGIGLFWNLTFSGTSDPVIGKDSTAVFHLFQNYIMFGIGQNGLERAIVETSNFISNPVTVNSNYIVILFAEWGLIPILLSITLLGFYLYQKFRTSDQRNTQNLPLIFILIIAIISTPERMDSTVSLLFALIFINVNFPNVKNINITFLSIYTLLSLYILLLPSLWAKSIIPPNMTSYWSFPLRLKESKLREELSLLSLPTPEQVQLHRDYVNEWVSVAPHNELALIQSVRWAYNTMPLEKSLLIAKANYKMNPWSPVLARWVVKIQLDLGKNSDAIVFLSQHNLKYQPPHPLLVKRLIELEFEANQQ